MSATSTGREIDFESLVQEHYRALYKFGLRLSGAPDAACDLTQQTFYVALRSAHQLLDQSKVKSWLFTILYRTFLRLRRDDKKWTFEELDETSAEVPSIEPNHLASFDAEAVRSALEKLDDIHRIPLVLFYQEDMSYREIADLLQIPLGTVMSRLSRGKLMLRRELRSMRP